MIVEVRHPVSYGYLPRRARIPRYDVGAGTTTVELRHVAERPREALRVGAERILAAEGRAWRILRGQGENVSPETFAKYLALDLDGTYRGEAEWIRWQRDLGKQWTAIQAWTATSPLMHETVNGHARNPNVSLDIAGAEVVEGGPEEASADVRAFLDDRVRIHGDRVLVREERLVGMGDLFLARPWTAMGEDPRNGGTNRYMRTGAIVAIRPDRLRAAWLLNDRPRRGDVPAGPWDALAGLPSELLGDDDIAWVANRLPRTILREIRELVPSDDFAPGADTSRPQVALGRMRPVLERLDRLSNAHAVRGDALRPVLDDLRRAVSLVVRIRDPRGGTTPRSRGKSQALATYEAVLRLLDEEYIPRLSAGPAARADASADSGHLAGLSPR